MKTVIEKISGKENMKHYAAELKHIRHKLLELNNKKDRLYQQDGYQKNKQDHFQKSYDKIISRVLLQIAEQVIMFVMNKDRKYAESFCAPESVNNYFLQKISETLIKIK